MKKLIVTAILGLTAVLSMPSYAATDNASLSVQITLTPKCVITPPGTLSVGYTSFTAGQSQSADTSFQVKCTGLRAYNLAFDAADAAVTSVAVLSSAVGNDLKLGYSLALTSGASGTGDGTDKTAKVQATVSGNQSGECATATGATCSMTKSHTLYVIY